MLKWEGCATQGKERVLAQVEGLGSIMIHRAEGGLAVDINGRRAWSAWRSDLQGIQFSMQQYTRDWAYLNSFTRER